MLDSIPIIMDEPKMLTLDSIPIIMDEPKMLIYGELYQFLKIPFANDY